MKNKFFFVVVGFFLVCLFVLVAFSVVKAAEVNQIQQHGIAAVVQDVPVPAVEGVPVPAAEGVPVAVEV